MKRSLLLILAFLSLPLLFVEGRGESSLEVTVERPSRIMRAGGYTTFIIEATNSSAQTIELQVIRIEYDRPDNSWEASVCSPEFCYDATVDTLDPYPLEAGATGGAQVHIYAGDTGAIGVTLLLDPQDGTEPVEVKLSAEIGTLPEPSLFIRVDSTASSAGDGDTVEFGLFILNTSGKELQPRLVRLETDYPDKVWSDLLCYFDQCREPEERSIEIDLADGVGAIFSVKMIAGEELGTTGEVEIMIDPGDSTEPSFHRFSLTVDHVSSVGENRRKSQLRMGPHPVHDYLRLSHPLLKAGNEVQVQIVNNAGQIQRGYETTIQDQGSLQIDFSSLLPGLYHCVIESGGEALKTSIIKN